MNIWISIISGLCIIAATGYIHYLRCNIDNLNHTVSVYKDIHDTDQTAINKLKSELNVLTTLTEKQTKKIDTVTKKVSKTKQTIKKVDNENYLDKPIPRIILEQLYEGLRKN